MKQINPITAQLLQQLFSPGESLGDIMGMVNSMQQQGFQQNADQRAQQEHEMTMRTGGMQLDELLAAGQDQRKESRLGRKETKQRMQIADAGERRAAEGFEQQKKFDLLKEAMAGVDMATKAQQGHVANLERESTMRMNEQMVNQELLMKIQQALAANPGDPRLLELQQKIQANSEVLNSILNAQ